MTWDTLHRWWVPFAVLLVAWLVSAPLAFYLERGMTLYTGEELGLPYGQGWALRDDVLASMIPYLLNLAVLFWLFDEDGSTRWAAFWAGLIAFARVIAPAGLTIVSGVTVFSGAHYVDWHTLRYVLWFQDVQMLALGVMVWMAFSKFVGDSHAAASYSPYYGEA
jgi:hypothetical protein